MLIDFLKTVPQYLLPKQAITALAGLLAGVKSPTVKNFIIRQFIAKYQVNMQEALAEDPTTYASFNEFFIRQLKPDSRPQAQADVISPVDGAVSELGRIKKGQMLQAKGRYYSVADFLANDPVYEKFYEGHFITLYLSPRDYHRVHMPLDGVLRKMVYIPGRLFSVQPTTARVIPQLFARNERLVIYFETRLGLMAMVMVGATIVGAIGTSWHGELQRQKTVQTFEYQQAETLLKQGSEVGYFKLGSTVVLLFTNEHPLQWANNLQAGAPVRFGQELAVSKD
ncbi:phosphatidylserine decarboxylase [Legionella birminghamensis]|uniref:Phosphatidylserine decarboxylase proenzyme n=1 Tax=Legionella birminghamensis TaxID=28083 RepID=A0A378IEF7_9GAMM|nr:archaetidylserine decarboxylase [Legionella birminghamensis]KTC68798.1 phosphatidylserine decarboxylase [Legionella birminghamensis]STX33260.1 phosphatidylserine decarboxylase [Legionella birminghamensis]